MALDLSSLIGDLTRGGAGSGDFSEGYPGPRTPGLISGPLGSINPFLGQIAQMLGMDRAVLERLVPGAASTFGSFGTPFQRANVLLNQFDMGVFSQHQAGLRTAGDLAMGALKTRMYENMGSTQPKAQGGRMSPLNIAMDLLVNSEYDLRGAANKFQSGLVLRGMGSTASDWFETTARNSLLSDAEQIYYGGSVKAYQGRVQDLSKRRTAEFDRFAEVQKGFVADRSQFGNLTGSEMATVYNEMSRSGAFAGFKDDQKVSTEVGKMSKALSSLKDIFKGPLKEVIRQLEDTFGGGVMGSFNADQVQSLSSQLLHTARLSGVNIETIKQMSQVSSGYASSIGGFAHGGGQAAMYTAMMLGSSVEDRRFRFVNEDKYASAVLQHVSGAQQSYRAKTVTGAYVAWLERTKRADSAENQAAFMNMTGGTTSLEGLARLTGSSQAVIEAAGNTMLAKELTATTTFATRAAMQENFGLINKYRGGEVSRVLSQTVKGLNLRGIDFNKLTTVDQITNAVMARNGGASRVQIEGIVRNISDATVTAFSSYENSQAFEKAQAQDDVAKKKEAEVRERMEFSKRISAALGAGGGGFSGMLTNLGKKTAGGTTVGELLKGLFGFTTKEEIANMDKTIGKMSDFWKGLDNNPALRKAKMEKWATDLGNDPKLLVELGKVDQTMADMLIKGEDEFGKKITGADWVRYSEDPTQLILERTKAGRLATLKKGLANQGMQVDKMSLKDIRMARLKQLAGDAKIDAVELKDKTDSELKSLIEEKASGLDDKTKEKITEGIDELDKLIKPGSAGVEQLLEKIMGMVDTISKALQ